jgi:serine/threonine protein kinase
MPPKLNVAAVVDEMTAALGADPYMSLGGGVHLPGGHVVRAGGVSGGDGRSLLSLKQEDLDIIANEKLGRGSSGSVRRAKHRQTGTPMAIKEIKLTSEHHLTEIAMELQALYTGSGVGCEYLIDFYGAYAVEGSVFLAMEFMEGSLGDLIGDGVAGIPEKILARITKMVLKGLNYLHTDRKLIHRDIKPGNILYSADGRVKITDFGVSQTLDCTAGNVNSFVGTVTYMSPERLRGEGYVTNVDIWSLGIMLVELFSGIHPFNDLLKEVSTSGNEAKFWALLQHLKSDKDVVTIPAGASPELGDFVHKCVAKNGVQRQTSQQLLLHPWITGNVSNDAEDMKMVKEFSLARRAEVQKKRGNTPTAAQQCNDSAAKASLSNALDNILNIG